MNMKIQNFIIHNVQYYRVIEFKTQNHTTWFVKQFPIGPIFMKCSLYMYK